VFLGSFSLATLDEQKANLLQWRSPWPAVPPIPQNDAMTRDQPNQFERSLRLLSPHIVEEKYKQLADRCRFLDLPSPARRHLESSLEMA